MFLRFLMAKWRFNKPKKRDFLIYDKESEKTLYLICAKKDCEVLDIRYESIYQKGKLRDEVLQGNEDSLNASQIYHTQEIEYLMRLSKAEGLCLQAYFTEYDEYPFLNNRNEVFYALNGFEKNLVKD